MSLRLLKGKSTVHFDLSKPMFGDPAVPHLVRSTRGEDSMDNGDEVVENANSPIVPADVIPVGWNTVTIEEILESWPVQLKLSTGTREYFLELASDAVIESHRGIATIGDLSTKQKIEIFIEAVPESEARHVSRIRILDNK